MMEKISMESESIKKAEITQNSQSKKKSAMMMNILSSGPSPGVGNSATNGRNAMEKMSKEKDEGGIRIKTFNKLSSGSSPGVGHSYTNGHQPEKLEGASEDRKDSDDTPIFEKLPGGPSLGGGHSYVQKSASTMRMRLASNALKKTSSSPSFHAPTPAVIFQPLVARCGTTERFLFNNTNIYGLRLIRHKHA